MKQHTFTDHGGQSAPNGKPTWPDSLELVTDKRRAFDIVQSILRQLADGADEITVTIVGKMGTETQVVTDPEYRKTCSKCRKRKRSRVYYEMREGKTVWLCSECWDEEEKLHEQVRSIVSLIDKPV